MSDNGNFGFAKLVPGFDFLQNLAKGAAQNIPQVPGLSNWVAPTLNVEELEKRITELKAVHYWLDQNGKALGATIQALEVQKMTLATLQGMNVKMGEVADALKLKPAASEDRKDKAKPGATAAVDPLQWWGALTTQFQEIASNAMKDATQKTAIDAAGNMATDMAREAMKAATGMAKAATTPAKKGAAGKSAPRKTAAAPRKTRSRG